MGFNLATAKYQDFTLKLELLYKTNNHKGKLNIFNVLTLVPITLFPHKSELNIVNKRSLIIFLIVKLGLMCLIWFVSDDALVDIWLIVKLSFYLVIVGIMISMTRTIISNKQSVFCTILQYAYIVFNLHRYIVIAVVAKNLIVIIMSEAKAST